MQHSEEKILEDVSGVSKRVKANRLPSAENKTVMTLTPRTDRH